MYNALRFTIRVYREALSEGGNNFFPVQSLEWCWRTLQNKWLRNSWSGWIFFFFYCPPRPVLLLFYACTCFDNRCEARALHVRYGGFRIISKKVVDKHYFFFSPLTFEYRPRLLWNIIKLFYNLWNILLSVLTIWSNPILLNFIVIKPAKIVINCLE